MAEPITAIVIKGVNDPDTLIKSGLIPTPPHTPDVIVMVIQPIVAILIRFANTFLIALVGLLVAAMTPAGSRLLYTSDFFTMLVTCSSLAFPGAGLGLIKDLVTIFGKLENRYPLLTGNV